jgi:hypothetical protein
VHEAIDESIELAYEDQNYTSEEPAKADKAQGIRFEVVRHPETKRCFMGGPPAVPRFHVLHAPPSRIVFALCP